MALHLFGFKKQTATPKIYGIAVCMIFENKYSYENGCLSADGRENPCEPVFGS